MTSLVSFINREMTSLGLKSLRLEPHSKCAADVTKLSLALACVEALNRVNASTKRAEDMQLSYRTLSTENATQANQIKKLKSKVEGLEKELAKFKEGDRQRKTDSAKNIQKLNSEKQNSKKTQALIQQKVVQLEHSLKRKEKENHLLKEKMESFLGSKGKSSTVLGQSYKQNSSSLTVQPATIEILNDNKPKRAKWMVKSTCACLEAEKQEVAKAIVSNLEEKQQILISENSQLRNLVAKINDKIADSLPVVLDACVESDEATFSMPMGLKEESVLAAVSRKLELLSKDLDPKRQLASVGNSCESLISQQSSCRSQSCDSSVTSDSKPVACRQSLLTDDEDDNT